MKTDRFLSFELSILLKGNVGMPYTCHKLSAQVWQSIIPNHSSTEMEGIKEAQWSVNVSKS